MIQLLRINNEANPILELGQLGYNTYSHTIKIGDGSTDFNTLPEVAANPNIYTPNGIRWAGDFLAINTQSVDENYMELKTRNLKVEGGAEGYSDGQINVNNVSSIHLNNLDSIYFKSDPSGNDQYVPALKVSGDSDIYMYGHQGTQIFQSIAAGNTFYGDLQGTADNSLLFDDMTSDDVYHVNNKPTKADVGLGNVQNQYNYGHVSLSGNVFANGYLTLGTCRLLCQRWSSINVSSFIGTNVDGVYIGQVSTRLAFEYTFKTAPNLMCQISSGRESSILAVRASRYDATAILELQIFATAPALSTISLTIFAMGEV